MTTPDGRTRTYRVVVPDPIAADGPVPLLIALHGGTGSGRQFERVSRFDDLAREHGFIVVYPDGIEIGGRGLLARGHVWNGGKCCSRAARENVDDVGFIAGVIDRVTADHAIDPARIYATGHSNGAIMSYRLACELADRVVAIGVQAGAIEVDDCSPAEPVSVLAIHGLADTNIPIEGGKGDGLSPAPFSSPTDAIGHFAGINGCGDPTTRTSDDNPDVTIETWRGCRDGTGVQFVRVEGAPHAWMGNPGPRPRQPGSNRPYADFDSSSAIWEFLAAHPRPD
jgi:polyhydroxybutyrate depolymerase